MTDIRVVHRKVFLHDNLPLDITDNQMFCHGFIFIVINQSHIVFVIKNTLCFFLNRYFRYQLRFYIERYLLERTTIYEQVAKHCEDVLQQSVEDKILHPDSSGRNGLAYI